jgi:hypothetical protein
MMPTRGRVSRRSQQKLHQNYFRLLQNAQGYWVFGLYLSSGILENIKEQNVPETGSISVLR